MITYKSQDRVEASDDQGFGIRVTRLADGDGFFISRLGLDRMVLEGIPVSPRDASRLLECLKAMGVS